MTDKSQTNDYTNEDPECNKNKENTEDNENIYSNTKEDEEHNTKDKKKCKITLTTTN